jgi:hypothetical protein
MGLKRIFSRYFPPRVNLKLLLLFLASVFVWASLATGIAFAQQPGKDGDHWVRGNEIVNRSSLITASVKSGASSVTVQDIASLHPISTGDLIMIHQAESVGMESRYELKGVVSVAGNTIYLSSELQNAYSAAGQSQVVRVPQYKSLTIPSGSSITTAAAESHFGGIVAIHVIGTFSINGTINATFEEAPSVLDSRKATGNIEKTEPREAASRTGSKGLVLLLVSSVFGNGTIHAYSGKHKFDSWKECGGEDCDGTVIVGGSTVLDGITIHAKEIHFAATTFVRGHGLL